VTESQFKNIKITVTKDIKADVKIYRDNALYDSKTYTYQDYLNQTTVPTPIVSPGITEGQTPASDKGNTTPSPTPKPVISAGG
jgi:hypothetical protein